MLQRFLLPSGSLLEVTGFIGVCRQSGVFTFKTAFVITENNPRQIQKFKRKRKKNGANP